MQGSATWRECSKEFFNERAGEISARISPATLCYVSGREQRLWTNPALYQDLMASIRTQLDVHKEHNLLEVGCAAGFLAPGLADLVRHYVGVDIAAKAVEVARSLGISNGEFKVGDGIRLPWPDATFDRVICYDVFTNFPGFDAVAKVLRDMVRVCKPGGKIMAGSIADAALQEAFQARAREVVKELDETYGPPPIAPQGLPQRLSLPQRLRRWFNETFFRTKPEVVCYYLQRGDFVKLAQDLGIECALHDIHSLNPYRGYRFNVVYTRPR